MELHPSPVQVYNCYSVTVRVVPVIVRTCNTQRISNLLWSEFLIITQIQFWKRLCVNLIYPNYLFSHTKISHWQIQIDHLFHIYIFHPQIQIWARLCFGKNGLGPQPAAYLFMTTCVFGHSIHQWDLMEVDLNAMLLIYVCCSKMLNHDHSNRHAH